LLRQRRDLQHPPACLEEALAHLLAARLEPLVQRGLAERHAFQQRALPQRRERLAATLDAGIRLLAVDRRKEAA